MTLWIILTGVTTAVAIAVTAAFTRRPGGVPTDTKTDQDNKFTRVRFIALAAIGCLVMVSSAGLYVATGKAGFASISLKAQPTAPKFWPFKATQQPRTIAKTKAVTGAAQPSVPGTADELVVNLAARLKKNPKDAKGWRMLGWSYFNTQRYDKASEAYAKAIALGGGNADLYSAYGETLVRAADGFVTVEAHEVFDKTLALNAEDARARFFKGLALEQDGKPGEAVDAWIAVLDTAPAGADWVEDLKLRVRELAAASSIDISARLPGTSTLVPSTTATLDKGPTPEQMAAAQSMTAEDRQAMIRGMVDRLANRLDSNPDDAEGWVKLMRSRMVLGDEEAALKALRRANSIFADVPETQARIADAAAELGLSLN